MDRKGLEAYNQFLCGWVKDVPTRKVCGKYLITARVSTSCVALNAPVIYMWDPEFITDL